MSLQLVAEYAPVVLAATALALRVRLFRRRLAR
jgi:hypothetical protein